MILSRKLIFFVFVVVLTATTILGAEDSNETSTQPPTTTKPPTTTTIAPSTASPPTSTEPSTVSPTTAPTTVPSTTAAPTSPPPHKEDMWIVKDPKTNKTCIIAQMKIMLDIPYKNVSNELQVLMAHIKVPGNATGSGSCNSMDMTAAQSLVLQWGEENSTSMVSLSFSANETSKEFWLESINGVIAVNNVSFPGIKPTVRQVKLVNGTRHFMTPVGNSYNCPIVLNIPGQLTPAVENQTGYFTLDHFQLEAFKNSTSNGFSSAIYCEGDNTPDLVPILVGCTMVALVVIVLGVYLWGRKRSQRGYLSM